MSEASTIISNIRPDGPTIVIEHQATGEQPVNVSPEGWTAPTQSNYDRVTRMNIEQFAGWICKIKITGCPDGLFYTSFCDDMSCAECWLGWLREEAEL